MTTTNDQEGTKVNHKPNLILFGTVLFKRIQFWVHHHGARIVFLHLLDFHNVKNGHFWTHDGALVPHLHTRNHDYYFFPIPRDTWNRKKKIPNLSDPLPCHSNFFWEKLVGRVQNTQGYSVITFWYPRYCVLGDKYWYSWALWYKEQNIWEEPGNSFIQIPIHHPNPLWNAQTHQNHSFQFLGYGAPSTAPMTTTNDQEGTKVKHKPNLMLFGTVL